MGRIADQFGLGGLEIHRKCWVVFESVGAYGSEWRML